MIANKCFTSEWIALKREEMPFCSDLAIEKSLHALALLERLAVSGLRFTFKGGTCMLLHLSQLRRISVDIDIVCIEGMPRITPILSQIGQQFPFIRWDEHERRLDRRPRRKHFRFFYRSMDPNNPEPFVFLDIVHEPVAHPFVEMKPVVASFIETVDPPCVEVPTLNGLLGDKLTAFAPETVGVRYHRQMDQQIIKQMFDVGELFPLSTDLSHVRTAHEASFNAENGFRQNRFTRNQALDDSIETAFRIGQLDLSGERAWNQVNRNILVSGISAINPTLVSDEYTLQSAKLSASRAAILGALLRMGQLSFAPYRYSPAQVAGLPRGLTGRYAVLNPLRETATEAYFNWHHVSNLLRPLDSLGPG